MPQGSKDSKIDSIKALFEELEGLTLELTAKATEPDEWAACTDIKAAIDKAEETFKRTKDINNNQQHTGV